MRKFIQREWQETKALLNSIPAGVMTLFVLALVLMNLTANKELISIGNWLALDCGMLISWVAFFTMDIVVRRFGPKASTKLTLVATAINLFVCLILLLVGSIPNNWAASYMLDGSVNQSINEALDATFSGTWYVLFGSTVAFITSSVTHAASYWTLSKITKKELLKSYISTSLGQFVDNMIFALIVSLNFFGWTLLQCITCAVTGMLVELIFELVFAPIGCKITDHWASRNVGKEYLEAVGDNT